MANLLAILAALSFALGATLQQKGALQTRAPEGDPSFLAEILRKPVWLAGGLLQAAGWALQAAALDRGNFVVVQALCSLSLVFALPLGAWLTEQRIGRRSIAGACAALLGIVLFITVGQPQGGEEQPQAQDWIITVLLTAAIMLLLAGMARRRRGPLSAVLFASAAGLSFAFQAAVTTVFMDVIGYGLGPILSSWTTYGLIVSALAGFALMQSALKTGFLAPALAASNASTLAMSVVFGVTVFGESLSHGQGRLLPAILGLALAVLGVALLALPETGMPDTGKPEQPDDAR